MLLRIALKSRSHPEDAEYLGNAGRPQMSRRFFRLEKVKDETGERRSSIYAGMAEGTFPKCFKIGPRAVAWFEQDIDEWKRAKLEAAGRSLADQ